MKNGNILTFFIFTYVLSPITPFATLHSQLLCSLPFWGVGGGFALLFHPLGDMINAYFLHCKIMQNLELSDSNNSASLINCVVEDPKCSGTSSFTFMNCVIKYRDVFQEEVVKSNYENCIVYQRFVLNNGARPEQNHGAIPTSCVAYNCVGLDNSQYMPNLFYYLSTKSANTYSSSDIVFKTYRGEGLSSLDNETFELTDSAKVTFLGTDGTQVGIYGGALPFELTATVPQIKKFDVAPKSTADGKLKVDIEVSAAAEEPK